MASFDIFNHMTIFSATKVTSTQVLLNSLVWEMFYQCYRVTLDESVFNQGGACHQLTKQRNILSTGHSSSQNSFNTGSWYACGGI